MEYHKSSGKLRHVIAAEMRPPLFAGGMGAGATEVQELHLPGHKLFI